MNWKADLLVHWYWPTSTGYYHWYIDIDQPLLVIITGTLILTNIYWLLSLVHWYWPTSTGYYHWYIDIDQHLLVIINTFTTHIPHWLFIDIDQHLLVIINTFTTHIPHWLFIVSITIIMDHFSHGLSLVIDLSNYEHISVV